MSTQVFLHVTSDGSIWVSNNPNDTPPGTITATYKIDSDPKFQKIGTLGGVFGSHHTVSVSHLTPEEQSIRDIQRQEVVRAEKKAQADLNNADQELLNKAASAAEIVV